MNVLVFYNSTQTYTNAVFEHINSFAEYSKHDFLFCHCDQYQKKIGIDLDFFDAVIIHFSIRLPYNQIPEVLVNKLVGYKGLKALFIQDEYDHTHRSWYWIKQLGICLVFTVVPSGNIEKVYPSAEFPETRFVNNLTGYVPDLLPDTPLVQTSTRSLIVGYRGRSLPVQYGQLGFEKVSIGSIVKSYCDTNKVAYDIAWDENSRIYGSGWYDFMASCRSMLGSESGSNVFDWDGTLLREVAAYKKENPAATDEQVYHEVVSMHEIPGLMNQISPRVFESIAMRTALVLFRGTYSGVIVADEHYIPLNLDGSNLDEVFLKLADNVYVDALVERAYQDVIASGKYSYHSFVQMVDTELAATFLTTSNEHIVKSWKISGLLGLPSCVTKVPCHYVPPKVRWSPAKFLWQQLPEEVREILRPLLPRFIRRR